MADGEKKVVLITGCGKGGIGYEYCKAFNAQGCHVIATDLPDRLHDLTDLEAECLPIDVTSDASAAAATSAVLAKHKRIDVLVNNAGAGSTGPLAELPLSHVLRSWEVNALSQLRMVQLVVPSMVARRSGVIVNMGSVTAAAATPWAGSYCAAKAAAHAMTDALRVELRPFNIHVVKVVPGAVKSNLGKANIEALKRAKHEWRMYKGFEEVIEERARASQGEAASNAAELARRVAARVLGKRRPPREIVFGQMSGLFAVLALSPLWARDWFFTSRFGLNKKI